MAALNAASTADSRSYGVYPTLPALSLLDFFDLKSNPAALNPPSTTLTSDGTFTFSRPFTINPTVYANALHVAWPITIASVYFVTVRYLNGVNEQRRHEPWAISKTRLFYFFVLLHNFALAVFSAWVFSGMANAIRQSWPGWDGDYGLAGAADALCKLHGPRGLGSAATFSVGGGGSNQGKWSFTDRTMKLADSGLPDSTDVGRIWNEGLAFYGWIFYLSKFYEVVDTAIILAKGKKSSDLQSFHHAGAMLCMWAGIRYMSPPIWMFTFINSGLHTLMYTYYGLTALQIRVPRAIKQTLTFLQIVQIIFGGSYALLHLFVAYDIPVETPYKFVHNLSTALPTAASSVSSAATSLATAANLEAWLKKMALRAAGEEGLAENVRNSQGETFGVDAVHAAQVEQAQEEIRYRLTTQRVNCLDTSGEVFAILLNAAYLLPLAILFINFFVGAYLRGKKTLPPKQNVKESTKISFRSIEDEIKELVHDNQGGATEPPAEVKEQFEEARAKASKAIRDLDEEKLQPALQTLKAKISKVSAATAEKTKKGAASAKEAAVFATRETAKAYDEFVNAIKELTSGKDGSAKEVTDGKVNNDSATSAPKLPTNGKTKEDQGTTSTPLDDAVKARGEAARKQAENGTAGITAKDSPITGEEGQKKTDGDEPAIKKEPESSAKDVQANGQGANGGGNSGGGKKKKSKSKGDKKDKESRDGTPDVDAEEATEKLKKELAEASEDMNKDM